VKRVRGVSVRRSLAGDRRGRSLLVFSPAMEAAAGSHGERAPNHTTTAGKSIASDATPTMRIRSPSLAN
jgi:uncharacterized membrane-anchored protein